MSGPRRRSLFVSAKRVASVVLDGLIHLVPAGARGGAKSRLLVIKLDALGDFILWLPVARALRKAFPPSSHEITLLGNQAWTDLAAKIGVFDRIRPVNRDRLRNDLVYRYGLMLETRRAGFTQAVQCQLSREFFLGDAIVRTCGAPLRVGPRGDSAVSTPRQLRISDHWYDRLLDTLPPTSAELKRNADFLQKLTGATVEEPFPSLRADWFEASPQRKFSGKYFVVAPGASIPGKMWPAERYAEICRRIVGQLGWEGVICGDATQTQLAQQICERTSTGISDLTGRTTIAELCALVSRASLYVGNDTGPAHMAVAFGVPAVVVMGGGHFGRFFPYGVSGERGAPKAAVVNRPMDCYGCDWHCRYVDVIDHVAPCLDGVAVESVWQAIRSVLAVESLVAGVPEQ
ncbi:MAG TPA: glycosyltransferase family 9 protein [Burkholderiales bacterium]|nr:glycosyltransferase family 9 protein [Burkholderiales bacterium]